MSNFKIRKYTVNLYYTSSRIHNLKIIILFKKKLECCPFRSVEQGGSDEVSSNPITFGKLDNDNEPISDKEKLVKTFESLVRCFPFSDHLA